MRCESVLYRLFYDFRPSLCCPVYKDFGRVAVSISTYGLIQTFSLHVPWIEERLFLSTVRVQNSLEFAYKFCLRVAELVPKVCPHQNQVCGSYRPTLVEILNEFKPRNVWLYGDTGLTLIFCDAERQVKWLLKSGFRRSKFLQVDFNTEPDRILVPFDSLATMLKKIYDICLQRATFFEERLKKYFNPKYGTEG